MIHISPRITGQLENRNVAAVRAALQAAIELEHATIPPYLYALYSFAPGTNTEVAQIIESVVREEMLHLTLAANILNALGGRPILDSQAFIPKYPGSLPGLVENELIVGLEPFSLDLVENIFMAIEEPEFSPGAAGTGHPLTIGQFYRMIRDVIKDLDKAAFTDPPCRQVTPVQMKEAILVTNKETASEAIDIIIDQGEGTARSPLEIFGKDYAHYYRFKEILEGHYFEPNPRAKANDPPDKQYINGKDIRIDYAGILEVPTNPTTADYPEDSAARKACIAFNYTYTSLLKSLHLTFNGNSENFDAVLGIMMSLKRQAIDMMSGTTTGGMPTGPSFEWQPVNGETIRPSRATGVAAGQE